MVKAFDGDVDCLRFAHPELANELFQVFAAFHLDNNGITVMQAIIFAKCIKGVCDAAKDKNGEPAVNHDEFKHSYWPDRRSPGNNWPWSWAIAI